MTPTLKEILEMFRLIVATFPYQEGTGLNTFTVFDSRSELNTDNLGRSYDDYEAGSFWSRDWTLEGADPSDMRKQYAILAVEHKVAPRVDFETGEIYHRLMINVLQKLEGPDGNWRNREQVDAEIFNMIRLVVSEFIDFRRFEALLSGGTTKTLWLSGSAAQALASDPAIEDITPVGGEIYPLAELGADGIYKTFFGVDNIRSAATEITVRTCEAVQGDFRYVSKESKKVIGI